MLVAPNESNKPRAQWPRFLLRAGADQTQIVNEKEPADCAEDSPEGEPSPGLMQPREQQRLHKRAADIKEVMAELERPSNDSDDVEDRSRPENEDDEQAGRDVGPEELLVRRNDFARALDEEGQRDALDDAD